MVTGGKAKRTASPPAGVSIEHVAHRGCAADYPENTLRALVESAARLGAVEFDVRRCGSGELVVVHDERLDRLTGVDGRVAETPWEVLRELDVLGTGEPIPSFEEVLDAVPSGTTLQVELKAVETAEPVATALAAADYGHDVRVSSFLPAALSAFAATGVDVPTGYLFSGHPGARLGLAERLDCANVHPHVDDCLRTDVVRAAGDRGFGVFAWGVDSPAAAEAVAATGVDGLTVDAAGWA